MKLAEDLQLLVAELLLECTRDRDKVLSRKRRGSRQRASLRAELLDAHPGDLYRIPSRSHQGTSTPAKAGAAKLRVFADLRDASVCDATKDITTAELATTVR